MADDAIQYLHQLNAIAPNKPFFLYYVPGGTHAPGETAATPPGDTQPAAPDDTQSGAATNTPPAPSLDTLPNYPPDSLTGNLSQGDNFMADGGGDDGL